MLWEILKRTGNESVKRMLEQIEKSEIKITIKVVRNSNNAFVGNFAGGVIDLADIEKFPEKDAPATIFSTFYHEICEQWARRKDPPLIEDFEKSHKFACEAESEMIGYTRSPEVFAVTKNDDGTEDTMIIYEKNGKRYVVIIRTGQAPDKQNEIQEVIIR